jgi:hypothetical protein
MQILKCIALKCTNPARLVKFGNGILPLCKPHEQDLRNGKSIRAEIHLLRRND